MQKVSRPISHIIFKRRIEKVMFRPTVCRKLDIKDIDSVFYVIVRSPLLDDEFLLSASFSQAKKKMKIETIKCIWFG